MSLATQRAAIKTILDGIAGIGVVHEYQRWAAHWTAFLSRFQDPATQTIRGCTVTRESTCEAWIAIGQVERRHTWVVTFYMGLDDAGASEIAAQGQVEVICDVLRLDPALRGSAENDSSPPQVRRFEPRLFGSVLCHVAEIVVIGKEVVDV